MWFSATYVRRRAGYVPCLRTKLLRVISRFTLDACPEYLNGNLLNFIDEIS